MHVKKSGIAALPDSLGKLTKLEVLNKPRTPPSALAPHPHIPPYADVAPMTWQVLKISECVSLAALPASLINLSNLLALEISDCALIAALPAGYGALTKLRHLDFSGCDDLADVLYDDPVVDELEARGCGMFGPGFEIEPEGYDVVKADMLRAEEERLLRLGNLRGEKVEVRARK